MAIGDPYLQPVEYEDYGLPSNTPDALVRQAGFLAESYCNRDTPDQSGVVNGFWVGQYREQRRFPADRQITRLSFRPTVAIVSAKVRQRLNRRSDIPQYQEDYLLLNLTTPGGIPKWQDLIIDDDHIQLDGDGRVWVATTLLGVKWSEIDITYTAGYAVIPEPIKQAVAMIVGELPRGIGQRPAGAKELQEGNTRILFGEPGFIPDDVKRLLSPYRVRTLA